ncbi:MAG TPA: helix-turn-helix domain-containing protein [Xanthobacteraceae bacterium]
MTSISTKEQATTYQARPVMFRTMCSNYIPHGSESEVLSGSARPLSLYVCTAVEMDCNASRFERSDQEVRLDAKEYYQAIVQLSGRSTMIQAGQLTDLGFGDITLIDATRSVTRFSHNRPSRWVSLHLPRQAVSSHLGLQPATGVRRGSESLAGRVLFSLIQDAVDDCEPSAVATMPYMQLAIYELLGALFGTPGLPTLSSHTDKLFKRISGIINNRFADPAFGPAEVAAEAGISLRYLQKLFNARGSSCTQFLQSVRLKYAARQLHRRTLLGASRLISEIAYASGFSDYTHFARQFRRRFGHPPAAHVPNDGHPESSQSSEAMASAGHVDLRAKPTSRNTPVNERAVREDAA